jgi:hypothetical protein
MGSCVGLALRRMSNDHTYALRSRETSHGVYRRSVFITRDMI